MATDSVSLRNELAAREASLSLVQWQLREPNDRVLVSLRLDADEFPSLCARPTEAGSFGTGPEPIPGPFYWWRLTDYRLPWECFCRIEWL